MSASSVEGPYSIYGMVNKAIREVVPNPGMYTFECSHDEYGVYRRFRLVCEDGREYVITIDSFALSPNYDVVLRSVVEAVAQQLPEEDGAVVFEGKAVCLAGGAG